MTFYASKAPEAINDPHIPACILVDTSGSVAGAIDNINKNLADFGRQVGQDPQAGTAVDVCVIEFKDTVRVVQDWRSARQMPTSFDLRAGGRTDLDGAVREGVRKIREREREYRDEGIEHYQKPYLILLTDGEDTVTGNVHEAAGIVGERIRDGKVKLFFLGYGEYKPEVAWELTKEQPMKNGQHMIMRMDDNDVNFDDFFRFMSDSLRIASASAPGTRVEVPSGPIAQGTSNVKVTTAEKEMARINFCLDDLLNS